MRSVLRGLVPVVCLAGPYATGRYHAAYVGHYAFPAQYSPWWLVVYGVTFALSAFLFGMPAMVERPRQAFVGSVLAASVPLAMASVFFVVHDPLIPRLVVVGTPFVLMLFLIAASLLHGVLWRLAESTDRVVFVVDRADRATIDVDLTRHPERKFRVLEILTAEDVIDQPGVIEATTRGQECNVLVLSESAQDVEPIVAVASRLHESGTRVRSLATFYDEWLGKLPLKELERTSLFFDIRDLHEIHYVRVKRIFDLVIATALSPLLLVSIPVVAIGNRLGNRGPLFFRQIRVGQHNKPFTIWKFRTMKMSSNAGGAGEWTQRDDPRITPFGRVMRKLRIDELPQVLNVFRGTLAIVGPRPEQPHYVAKLTEKIPFYAMRHIVKPGITGWAQVKFPYGASDADALEKLQYELYYLKHQGPTLDARVCARTISTIMLRGGQ